MGALTADADRGRPRKVICRHPSLEEMPGDDEAGYSIPTTHCASLLACRGRVSRPLETDRKLQAGYSPTSLPLGEHADGQFESRRWPISRQKSLWIIDFLWVSTQFRGRGIAGTLIRGGLPFYGREGHGAGLVRAVFGVRPEAGPAALPGAAVSGGNDIRVCSFILWPVRGCYDCRQRNQQFFSSARKQVRSRKPTPSHPCVVRLQLRSVSKSSPLIFQRNLLGSTRARLSGICAPAALWR
jgi:hypothetical protein